MLELTSFAHSLFLDAQSALNDYDAFTAITQMLRFHTIHEKETERLSNHGFSTFPWKTCCHPASGYQQQPLITQSTSSLSAKQYRWRNSFLEHVNKIPQSLGILHPETVMSLTRPIKAWQKNKSGERNFHFLSNLRHYYSWSFDEIFHCYYGNYPWESLFSIYYSSLFSKQPVLKHVQNSLTPKVLLLTKHLKKLEERKIICSTEEDSSSC